MGQGIMGPVLSWCPLVKRQGFTVRAKRSARSGRCLMRRFLGCSGKTRRALFDEGGDSFAVVGRNVRDGLIAGGDFE